MMGDTLKIPESIYHRAKDAENDKIFFISLLDFVKALDDDPVLVKVQHEIVNLGKADQTNSRRLEQEAHIEMDKVFKEVKLYLLENKIQNKTINEKLEDYQLIVEGKMHSSNGPTKQRYFELTYALMLLAEDESKKHIEFCQKYGIVSDEGRITDWTFSKSYTKWTEEIARIDRISVTRVWFAWDKLAFLYNAYNEYEKYFDELRADNRYFDLYGLVSYVDEIKTIVNGKKPETNMLHRVDYEMYLDKVWEYLKSLQSIDDVQREEANSFSYDSVNCNLVINDKLVKFQANGFSASLLKFLSNRKGTKKASWDIILETIENQDNGGDVRSQKVYDSCKNIQDRIVRHTGIIDFLDFDTKEVRINPKYQRQK